MTTNRLLASISAIGLAIALCAGLVFAQPAEDAPSAPAPASAPAAPDVADVPAPAAEPVEAGTVTPAVDPALAAPADAPTPPVLATSVVPEPTVSAVVAAIRAAKYVLAGAGILFLLVALARKYAWEPEAGWAKKAVAFALAFAGTGGLSVWQTGSVGVGVIAAAVLAGLAAAGLNDWIKDVAPAKEPTE